MAGTKDGAEADALGESVSLEAGDLPRKPGRLLPSLFHPALSCVAADATCAKLHDDPLKQHTAAGHDSHLPGICQYTSQHIWVGFSGTSSSPWHLTLSFCIALACACPRLLARLLLAAMLACLAACMQ